MRQADAPEPQYALGEPVNRKPAPELTPIAGRPNWYQPRSTIASSSAAVRVTLRPKTR